MEDLAYYILTSIQAEENKNPLTLEEEFGVSTSVYTTIDKLIDAGYVALFYDEGFCGTLITYNLTETGTSLLKDYCHACECDPCDCSWGN